MNLPQIYRDTMKELLGDEYNSYLAVFDTPIHQGLRVNTSKLNPEAFEALAPFFLKRVPWVSNGFYYEREAQPSRHPYYYAGLYYLQEPSAMTPASRLPISSGDYILDMCAAPGGKAAEIGARLLGTGMLLANDISNSRAKALLKNLELTGLSNYYVTSEDPDKLKEKLPSFFDKIIIDAPCSGEGMFHKEPGMIKYWMEKGPSFYHEIQCRLLEDGYQMLKPGGMLLYSTCTFSELENEGSISSLLDSHPDMEFLPVQNYAGFCKGIPYNGRSMEHCVRIFPHKMDGEGHFLALLQKRKDTVSKPTQYGSVTFKLTWDKLPGTVRDFLEEAAWDFPSGCFEIDRERIYYMKEPVPMPAKLRYLRTGLYLGELKKNRFHPSQAFAMALKKSDYKRTLDFCPEDIRVIKYLKGETIFLSDGEGSREEGWHLVCVSGFPLGWCKVTGHTVKNKYYPGWRMQ